MEEDFSVGLLYNLSSPESIQISRIAPSQVQNPALALIKLHVVHAYPVFQFVKLSLQGLSTL